MYSTDRFEFTTAAPERADVTIDETTQSKEALLDRLSEGLSFPDYFGRNWDALHECIGDFWWSQAPEVIVDHAGIPQLPARELRIYLEVLIDAVERRAADEQPRLRIVFRVKDRETLAELLLPSIMN